MDRLRPYLPWSVALVLPIAILVGARLGAGAGVLVAASAVLFVALGLVYKSVTTLVEAFSVGPTEVALDEGEGSSLVHEKAAILRALKDLEYERAVGKVTEEDFETLTKQYRARAVEILARIDRDLAPWRKKAEDAVQRRLEKGPEPKAAEPVAAARACPACRAANDVDATFCKKCGQALPRGCAGCGTANDADATFCKKCGRRIGDE
jgi:ribosomal protein L40E